MYLHCKLKYGVNSIIAAYEQQQPGPIAGADFQTGNIAVDSVWVGQVFVGPSQSGAVGTVEQDYKAAKVAAINSRTDALIEAGFDHNGHHFRLREEDQRNAMGLMLRLLSGADLSGQFFRAEGSSFHFVNNDDFLTWYQAGVVVVENATSTGSALKDQVYAAENTQAAMDSIVDNR